MIQAGKQETKAATVRVLAKSVKGQPTSDGAGVRLNRVLGSAALPDLDPFLLLDEFFSDDAADYIAGFPAHPHRGFQTVTYMLDGHMRHEDHLGNQGELTGGGVQWMNAAGGIIHSEMPQQRNGRMRGFQLWINLPAKEKMSAPWYRDIPAERIPVVSLAGGVTVKVIAGRLHHTGGDVEGAVAGETTDPLFLDVKMPPGAVFRHPVGADHNSFVYPYDGAIVIGEGAAAKPLAARTAGVLGPGATIAFAAGAEGASVLMLAAKPLREPVARYGPFVMNTREQITQAFADYQNGTLAKPARAAEGSSQA